MGVQTETVPRMPVTVRGLISMALVRRVIVDHWRWRAIRGPVLLHFVHGVVAIRNVLCNTMKAAVQVRMRIGRRHWPLVDQSLRPHRGH